MAFLAFLPFLLFLGRMTLIPVEALPLRFFYSLSGRRVELFVFLSDRRFRKVHSNVVFLAEDVFLSIFFPTQPAPFKTGVIPAVLPVKGLR